MSIEPAGNGRPPESEPPASASKPLDERHPPLSWTGERFALLVDALRDMSDDMVPQLEAIDTSRLTPDALAAMDALSPARRAHLKEAVTLLFETRPDGDEDQEDHLRKLHGALDDAFQGDAHLIGTFWESFLAAAAGPDRVSIMRNSMLLQLISGFEVLVASVATRFFIGHPGALESTERDFSLAELQTFADMDDAIDTLIARRVSKLMYGDLDDWATWLKTHCKADLPRLANDWESVQENFQRRHVLVHNGGLVSRQYLSKVPEATDKYSVGDRLRVDQDYLHKAFDEFDILGASIIAAARSTWESDQHEEIARLVLRRTYALLLRRRWIAVAKLAVLRQFLKAQASIKEALRANELCARARIDGAESVIDEARDWDVSASAARFQLVRLVLVCELDEAINRIPKMIKSEELTLGELQTWPILEPVRRHDRWDSLATELGIGQDDAPTAD